MVNLINLAISKLSSVCLRVRTLVCDQGSPNPCAMKLLGVTPQKPFFFVNQTKVFVVFDAPHLFKNVRNNLLNWQQVKFSGGVAKWCHIVQLFEADQKQEEGIIKARTVTKLTEKHLNPVGREKISVKLATQVFSHTVKAALLTASKMPEIGNAAEETASFVGKMNDIFDALNSKMLFSRNKLNCALNIENSNVAKFLKSVIPWVNSLRVVTKNDREKVVPCFVGLALTIKSVLLLWKDLKVKTRDCY
uniref:Transposable element P transposase-like GTP-binding insertion domain-containing protein n=1 Tax=Graphocephala atropunctata TaxID=36148 RepID=A0A1B6MDZ4_9HEMI